MNKTQYVNTLSIETQNTIRKRLYNSYYEQIPYEKAMILIDEAFDSRLCDLQDTIYINDLI